MNNKTIAIFGAGPSGLFCAYHLTKMGHSVTLYEKNKALAKKLLVAGSSGLNLTNAMERNDFLEMYYEAKDFMRPILDAYSPLDLRNWCDTLGIETFEGTSGRVFPSKMSAADLLNSIKKELLSYSNFTLKSSICFKSFKNQKTVIVSSDDSDFEVTSDNFIFALGGASWKETGSDGSWSKAFHDLGIRTNPFTPINCGFHVKWSDFLKEKLDNSFLKDVSLSLEGIKYRGDISLTNYGVESGIIYMLSKHIVDKLKGQSKVKLSLDLLPDISLEKLREKMLAPKKKLSTSNFLRKHLKLSKEKILLINELAREIDIFESPEVLKNLELYLCSPTEIDQAISTGGGIELGEVDKNLALKKYPNIFVCGEMLDWQAPTGGFLLQACFSQAFVVANNFR